MRFRKHCRWIPLALVAGLFVSPGLAAEKDWDAPVKKWAKGPVSYLLTEVEEKEYKKLKTEDERAGYIEAFWERRSPREGELLNPFQIRFYQRVETVDALLEEQGIPAGWKSDLGRVLILLGQPDEFQFAAEDAGGAGALEGPAVPTADVGGGGGGGDVPGGQERTVRITMLYDDLTRLGLRANLELELLKDGLTTRLETRVNLGTDAVRGLDREVLVQEFPAGEEAPMEEFLSLGSATEEGGTAEAQLGELSVQRGLLLEILDGGEVAQDIPFESTTDVYKAKEGQTYVAVSLGIGPAAYNEHGGEGKLHPVAALRDQEDEENLFLYDSDDLFAPCEENTGAGEGGLLRFQAGDGVKPGNYTLITGWVGDDGEAAGLKMEDLVVPDFSLPTVQISSITLAESWESVEKTGSDLKRPYILGNRRVVPKVTPAFPVNGDLALYYQIYNAADEGTDPDLRIGYHVYRKRGTRFTKAATVPPMSGVKELVQIYELALTGWPRGEYKIKVNVTDNRSGAFDEREVLFHIE
jgi:GWxTD domain-containing protein